MINVCDGDQSEVEGIGVLMCFWQDSRFAGRWTGRQVQDRRRSLPGPTKQGS